MCIGVYSSDALEEGLPGCVTPQILRGRIEAALCHFNLQYPEFRYGVYYELGFTSRYHKPTREDSGVLDEYDIARVGLNIRDWLHQINA